MEPSATFAAWIAALTHPHDRGYLVAAVTNEVRIERHGPIERDHEPGPPVEVFDGVDAAGRWLRRLPPRVTFALVGAPVADGDRWRIEYALEVDGFENGGLWLARQADDGRLLHLSHRPFPLPEKYRW